MAILLIVIGTIFALIFGINSILCTAQGREKVSFFETLLAFLALVFPVLALVTNNGSTQPLPLVNMAAIGLGILVILISLITFIIERRKPARLLAQRRSVLGVGLGILLVVATFVAPVAAKLPSPSRAANAPASSDNVNIAQIASPNAVVSSPTPVETVEILPTRTLDVVMLQMSATPTRFPSPMPTPTNTPFIIATTTQETSIGVTQSVEQAAAQITGCTVVTRQNVNLRSGPGTTYELLLTIPFSTTLDVSAKNKAADWWYVTYDNQNGWVSGDYVNAAADCGSLPTKSE